MEGVIDALYKAVPYNNNISSKHTTHDELVSMGEMVVK